jgi:DNA gyrase subunit A
MLYRASKALSAAELSSNFGGGGAHILEGLKRALDMLDAVIALIRASKEPAAAKEGLMNRFEFSAEQAQAILDMRLQRLTGLEREKIVAEYEETLKLIARFKEILASEKALEGVVVEELKEAGNTRREADPDRR